MTVLVTASFLRRHHRLPQPSNGSDKEDRGQALVVAGSPEVPGAALLSGEAVLRAGAGKVTIATPGRMAISLAPAIPEARLVDLRPSVPSRIAALLDGPGVVLIGPGMEPRLARSATAAALGASGCVLPLILDAAAQEGIWQKGAPLRRRARKAALVLTPHAGEMAALVDRPKEEIRAAPEEAASRAAAHLGAVIVLKGATTFVATPDGQIFRHRGNVGGLATSGSGDVLAGILAGLVACGADVLTASLWAVLLHAEAGRRLAKRIGTVGFLARELSAEVPQLLDNLR